MKQTRCTISVRMVPAELCGTKREAFYREVENCINVDRPKVVLDCSMLSRLDSQAIYVLLCCLEEAMKRNGDVRLAGLQAEAKPVLKSTGLDQIFQVFESIDEAVDSFRAPRLAQVPAVIVEASEDPVQVNAA